MTTPITTELLLKTQLDRFENFNYWTFENWAWSIDEVRPGDYYLFSTDYERLSIRLRDIEHLQALILALTGILIETRDRK